MTLNKVKKRDRRVTDRIIHQSFLKNDFIKGNVDNDFAILKLAKPVAFTKYVNPICLPQSSNKNFDSVEAMASGWESLDKVPIRPIMLYLFFFRFL